MPTLKGYSINERVIQTLANQGYDLDDLKQLRLHFLVRSFDSEISLKDEIRNRFGVDFNRSLVLRCVELSKRMSIYRIHWFIKDFFLPQSFFVPSAWDWLMVSPFVLFFMFANFVGCRCRCFMHIVAELKINSFRTYCGQKLEKICVSIWHNYLYHLTISSFIGIRYLAASI